MALLPGELSPPQAVTERGVYRLLSYHLCHQWENSTQAEVSGKGKPTLELPRDRARLDKYIAAFEALLEKERNTP